MADESFRALLARELNESKLKMWAEVLVNLGVYALGVYAWIRHASPNVAMGAVLLGAALSVFLVYYHSKQVWTREHEARLAAQERLTKDEPVFTGYVNKMAFDDVDGEVVGYLLLSVENAGGRASILHNWRVFVQPPEKLEYEVKADQPGRDEEIVLVSEVNGYGDGFLLKFTGAEFMAWKSYPTPIQPGAGVRGFLRCQLPKGLPEGTRFIVRFKDAKKQIYTCEYDTAERRDRSDNVRDIGQWPGVEIRHGRITVAN